MLIATARWVAECTFERSTMAPDSTELDHDQARLIASLRSPAVFGGDCARVTVLETHISYVLLTGRHAYKIKKSVNLAFLDFTTLAARRFYCERELELNRRHGVSRDCEGEGHPPACGPAGSRRRSAEGRPPRIRWVRRTRPLLRPTVRFRS